MINLWSCLLLLQGNLSVHLALWNADGPLHGGLLWGRSQYDHSHGGATENRQRLWGRGKVQVNFFWTFLRNDSILELAKPWVFFL